MSEYHARYRAYQDAASAHLHLLMNQLPASTLREAMEYSLYEGGKMLRPVLTLAACDLAGGDRNTALHFAAAVEMIHTYSLIHDDLPCMDDDSLRRGKPANHIMFGEDLAVLAGDGLLSYAFEVMLEACINAGEDGEGTAFAAHAVAAGCGVKGMVYGQSLDVRNLARSMKEEELREVHRNKTGALIKGALLAGAYLGSREHALIQAVGAYGDNLGIAFQIADDILDATQSAEELGKTPNKDADSGKITYVSLYGVDGAKHLCREYSEKAANALFSLPKREFLTSLATEYADRTK